MAFLRERLRLPDVALVVLFGVRPWVWAALVVWLICAPIAHRLEVLPIAWLAWPQAPYTAICNPIVKHQSGWSDVLRSVLPDGLCRTPLNCWVRGGAKQ